MVAFRTWIPIAPIWLLYVLVYLVATVWVYEASGQDLVTRVPFQGQEIPGRTVIKTSSEMYLLGRDGQLRHFLRSDVGRTIRTNEIFSSYSFDEMKTQLSREFGRGFEVSVTGNFVVVHPVGGRSVWPRRFDELYRSFLHYFSARGVRLDRPEFPFVAIVFEDRESFARYAARQGDPINSNVLGYYSPLTNRIALFDQTQFHSNDPNDEEWAANAATLIHEAAHQSAFNTGIHNRFAPPARWVTEGLGTMFEARGVSNSFQYTRLSDRVNEGQLRMFERYLEQDHQAGDVARLVSTNRMFEENPANAYALSWALSFYFAETQARNYVGYLRDTGSREDFTAYPSAQQLQDFTSRFGENVDLIESRMIRFIRELPR